MQLANFQNVSREYGPQTVLKDVSFRISSGQKLGLIGANGSGKTTILRILCGRETPSSGGAVVARGVSVGYVPQHVTYDDDQTVLGCVLTEHSALAAALRAQEERVAQACEADMASALRAYEAARDRYDHVDGDRFPQRAEAMLDSLGLAGKMDQKIGSLSGGEKNVLALAEALLAEPDLLLLDEPGNHLDYLGVAWLEDFLSRYKGAVVIVSHNRYLLDHVVGGVLQLESGRVTYYDGGYSDYRAKMLRDLLARQLDYDANQKRLTRLEALVKKFAEIASRTSDPAWGKRLRARRSQLAREQAQAVEKPVLADSAIRADFTATPSRANVALQVRGYSKSFGDLKLFDNAELDIACGERVALVGLNGSGKTTLLRDIVEHGGWDNPRLRTGPSLEVGYCAQQQEVLHGDRSILQELTSVAPIRRQAGIALLARFGFSIEDNRKRVAQLSGGERNRLQLALLMVLKPNFLVLDEPTNHLDIPAREAVEEALEDFNGTILVVSHDRYFLDKIVQRVVEVRDRKLVSYAGNFSDFWSTRQAMTQRAVGRVGKRRKQRERPRPAKTGGKQVAALEQRITDLEQRKLTLERDMGKALSHGDPRRGRDAARQLAQLKAQLDSLYARWLEAGS